MSTNMQQEIRNLINDCVYALEEEKDGQVDLAVENICDLISATVRGCVPAEAKELEIQPASINWSIAHTAEVRGFNQCRDTLTHNLKEKGVLI